MAIVRYQPWSLLARLHDDINRRFDDRADNDTNGATADWVPAVDIEEYNDRFELFVDLPGVPAKDVDITLEDGVLTLSGARAAVHATDELLHARRERGNGRFHRRFVLPDTVDAERVEARERDGVIGITIPKQAKAQPRKIQIAA